MNYTLPGTEAKYQLKSSLVNILRRSLMADMILGGIVTFGLLLYLGYVLIKVEEL
jgi:hypothetical protein